MFPCLEMWTLETPSIKKCVITTGTRTKTSEIKNAFIYFTGEDSCSVLQVITSPHPPHILLGSDEPLVKCTLASLLKGGRTSVPVSRV